MVRHWMHCHGAAGLARLRQGPVRVWDVSGGSHVARGSRGRESCRGWLQLQLQAV